MGELSGCEACRSVVGCSGTCVGGSCVWRCARPVLAQRTGDQSLRGMEGERTNPGWGWSGHSSGSTVFPSYINASSNAYYPTGSQPGPAGPAYPLPNSAAPYNSPAVQTDTNYPGPVEVAPAQAGYYEGSSAELGMQPGPAELQLSKFERADESEGGVEDYHGHDVPLSVLAGASHRASFPGLRKAFLGAASRNRVEEVLRWKTVASNLEWDRCLR